MKYNEIIKPLVCMMTQSTCYNRTIEMQPKGILWHSTGANNPTVKRYVQPDDNAENKKELLEIIGKNQYNNDWNHIYHEAGLNAWIGRLADNTVSSVQTMPWNFRPWGCGGGKFGSLNNGFIQFEICEDDLKNPLYFDDIYNEACELTAFLCLLFNIDPLGTTQVSGIVTPTIVCHQDSYRLGLGNNHIDVLHWLPLHGKSMASVRNDVNNILKSTLEEDVLDMTKLELAELITEIVKTEQQKEAVKYHLVEDVPEYWRPYVKELVDLDVINGGTSSDICDNDINISEDIVKSLVIMMQYIETKYRERLG